MTLVTRLLRHPVVLIRRHDSGVEDSWGLPVPVEERIETMCHYQQLRTGDQDRQTDLTVFEDVTVFLPADTDLGPYDAIELTMGTRTETMEVVGQPAPANNARSGSVNHIKLVARRAGP